MALIAEALITALENRLISWRPNPVGTDIKVLRRRNMNLQSYSRRLLALAGAVLAVSACGGASTSSSSNQTANVKIMVGGLNKQIYLPNQLAQQLGYFKEQNLDVTLIDEGSGQGSEEEVVAGNVAVRALRDAY